MSVIARWYDRGAAVLLAGRVVQMANSLLLSVLVLRLFGLETLGAFALGIVPLALLAVAGPMGLNTYLPRAQLSHGQACTAGLVLHLLQLPVVGVALTAYAALMAADAAEASIILLVSLSGYFVALSVTGQMLAVMRGRFLPGLVAPVLELLGLVLGALLARTPAGLALALLAARGAGALSYWILLRYERLAPRRVAETARRAAGYVAPDSLTMLADQLPPLLLAVLGTRADVGLFRLAQQMLTAADTPAWTLVQARYPSLVGASREALHELAGRMRRLGWAAAALCLAGSWVFAYAVLHTPALFPLMLLLAPALAWRYATCFHDFALRAAGRVREGTLLGALKLLAAAALLPAAVLAAGVWGAAAGAALVSVGAGVVYRRVHLGSAPHAPRRVMLRATVAAATAPLERRP